MFHSPGLKQKISAAVAAKGADYIPRTRHLVQGKPVYTNRLIFENSPYLLQHAHNPVDWFPWGEEAFEQAKTQNKPVFLSIGYATCHWCHVMEEESFENTEIADLLNAYFIAVKVDREQYPDIDQAYMTAVQMLSGRGGWPMSSFLTPDGKPFFGGTYYPAETFADLLKQIHAAWLTQHDALMQQAERIADAVHDAVAAQEQLKELDQTLLETAVSRTLARYDDQFGGFSGAPKFPNEPLILMLLQYCRHHFDPALLNALSHTLSAMAQGGIYDQVGGGFHRYSVDARWLVPHFEKMLYNQAYLARVYSRAYRIMGNRLYARVVRQTLDYALREMTTADGLFYSATDADSEGCEGAYFVWSEHEIRSLLQPADAEFIIELFGMTPEGNFEGKNILYLPDALDDFVERRGISLDKLLARLDPLLEILLDYRSQRVPPLTDAKIITAWNGMLIAALAEAADMLSEPKYLESAKQAARSLWASQRPETGLLWRVVLAQKTSIPARQDDYVHFSEALIALYDATGEQCYLDQASELADEMLELFTDRSSGALVMGRDPLLFTQPSDAYDGALPSGNAVAVRVLSRLALRSGDVRYDQAAGRIVKALAGRIDQYPEAFGYLLAQVDQMRHGESGSCRYAAGGAVKIRCNLHYRPERVSVTLRIAIRNGWHINGHRPLQHDLVATEIGLPDGSPWRLESIDYPEASLQGSEFEAQARALYQGDIRINAELTGPTLKAGEPVTLTLRLQACNRQACLPSETLKWVVFPDPN
ncbi:MAG: thioredoxin domain-containing protein [Gammaproteobacteria bacterium]